MCSVTIGVWNGLRRDWLADYYPMELPEDWRPAYYSNDYACVGLPADTWDFQGVASWSKATGEDFVFWLGCNLQQLNHPDFPGMIDALGPKLAGLCLDATDEDENCEIVEALVCSNRIPVYRMQPVVPGVVTSWQGYAAAQSGTLGFYCPKPEDDIRQRRAQLEAFAAMQGSDNRYLLIDGSPSVVEECQQLISLLGI